MIHEEKDMPGITFFRTMILNELEEFYTVKLGMEVWLKQEDCTILRYDNLLVGFCQRESCETGGMITFFYDSRTKVDAMYHRLEGFTIDTPKENKKYRIYQFFAKDPEERTLEFQCFLHSIPPI